MSPRRSRPVVTSSVSASVAAIVGVLLALLATLLIVASAHAGSYLVYSCTTPAGDPAPTDGWHASVSGQPYLIVDNTCGTHGVLQAAVPGNYTYGAGAATATWHWSSPPDTSLGRFRVWRSESVGPAGNYASGVTFIGYPGSTWDSANAHEVCTAPGGCSSIGSHDSSLTTANLYASGPLSGVSDVYFVAICGGFDTGTCPDRGSVFPAAADIRVHAFEATIVDSIDPVVEAASGDLLAGGTFRGTRSLTFTARDRGGGIYRTLTQVQHDGAWDTVDAQIADTNGGRCQAAAVTGNDHEFLFATPCKTEVNVRYDLNTGKVPDGVYDTRVVGEDAGGNLTQVWRGTVTFSNDRGLLNGSPSSDTAQLHVAWYTGRHRLRSATRTVRYPHSALLRGRLLSTTGQPIANARIDVSSTLARASASSVAERAAVTDTQGTFAYRLPRRTTSRTVLLQYRARANDQTPAAQAQVQLRVRPKVTLSVRLYGTRVRYTGRLAPRSIPVGGKTIVIQGRVPGAAWQTFAALRAHRRTGRFGGVYRLKVRSPGARLQFRVVVPRDASFPFHTGWSRVVTRHVG